MTVRSRPFLQVLFVVLSAAPAFGGPSVLLFSSVGTTDEVVIRGQVRLNAPSAGSSTFSKNLRLLTASSWQGARVDVQFLGREASTTSGPEGEFEVLVRAGQRAFAPGLQVAQAQVNGAKAVAVVDVISPGAPYYVISDFDDTIAATQVLAPAAMVDAVLFKDGLTHPAVDGMARWYQCLKAGPFERPVFALVSGSPVQFADRIKHFVLKNHFPQFGLYLRALSPATLRDYKQPLIRQLLKTVPQKVVLIGDSGEYDPEVYAQMRREFPDRVLAIYIRDVGRSEDPKRFDGMLLFSSAQQAAADSVLRGLASEHCVNANTRSQP